MNDDEGKAARQEGKARQGKARLQEGKIRARAWARARPMKARHEGAGKARQGVRQGRQGDDVDGGHAKARLGAKALADDDQMLPQGKVPIRLNEC